jgi:hypothetical protein
LVDISQEFRHLFFHPNLEKAMVQDLPITALLTERAAQENLITGVEVTDRMIRVHLEPKVATRYRRPDCQEPVSVERHDSDILIVQGLGLQGKALRYQVKSIRLGYRNDAGKFITFTVPVPGVRPDLLVTDEVVEQALYLNVDRNLSLPVTAEMLHDLYRVETSSSALDRWKTGEAEALPSIGQLIQRLDQKKDHRPASG